MRRRLGSRRVAAASLVVAVCLVSSAVASAAQWSVQRGPEPVGSRNAYLQSVSCISRNAQVSARSVVR